MTWKPPVLSKYAWRGGIIALAVAVTFFFLGRFGFGTDLWEDIAAIFFMPMFAVSLGISMTMTPPSLAEAGLSILFGVAISVLFYFFIGAALGTWYGKAKHKVVFLAVVIGLPIILVGLVMARHEQKELARWRRDGYVTRAECDQLGDEKKIGECYSHNYNAGRFFSLNTSDVSICNRIMVFGVHEARGCAAWFGLLFREDTCNKFEAPLLRAACISNVAPRRDDLSLCDTIPDDLVDNIGEKMKDGCIQQVAEYRKHRAFCEQVFVGDNSGERESCLKSLR